MIKDLEFKIAGFTLVELLVVAGVLAALGTLVMISFTGARSSARDTQRKSDIKQYQTALEQFANRNNSLYPGTNDTIINTGGGNTLCGYVELTSCSTDPEGTDHYEYSANGSAGGTASATQYVLWARLERTPLGGNVNYWVTCSVGRSGCVVEAAEPTNSTCPATLDPC